MKKYPQNMVLVWLSYQMFTWVPKLLEAQWHKMVRWFNTIPLAKTVKYLVLSGDCVDGVGIYPGQDKELAIPDLYNAI